RNVRIGYLNGRLEASLSNFRISSMPRAVLRAARTMLSYAPLKVRELRITYLEGSLPIATYTFINVPLLQRYFNGLASRGQLAPYVAIEYARPEALREEADRAETLAAFQEPLPQSLVLQTNEADFFALRGENVAGGRVYVRPAFSSFFNDPRDGRWGADLDVNWLKQRDFDGWFGHSHYETVTAIASLNYRMAHGVTGTLRAGRFLARDEGVRAEVKRRFASGFEVGAWYTVTNGNDITSPGSPSSPYHDKGVFMLWRLDTLLTRD